MAEAPVMAQLLRDLVADGSVEALKMQVRLSHIATTADGHVN